MRKLRKIKKQGKISGGKWQTRKPDTKPWIHGDPESDNKWQESEL